jgi:YD repeat-containing protein
MLWRNQYMKSCKLKVAVRVAVFQLILAVSAFSQVQVQDQGAKPFDATHGGDLDRVSLSNGGLSLHIPLASFPQRGNLQLSFFVSYTNQMWSDKLMNGSNCQDPNNPDPPVCQYQWTTSSNLLFNGPSVLSNLDWWLQSTFVLGTQGDPDMWTTSVTSPDGNGHMLGGGINQISQGPLRSLDAMGISVPNPTTLIMPNGTQLTYASGGGAPTLVTDSNGNQISISSTGWTDSLGRSIPGHGDLDGTEAGVSTSDLSTCPSGTASAMVWNVPGIASVNSGIRTFKFCYAFFPLQTAFQQSPMAGSSTSAEASGGPGATFLSAIVLPDLSMWTFAYDSYGDVSQVGFPTGGSISYTYVVGSPGCGAGSPSDSSDAALWVTSRTVNANDGTGPHTWTYTYSGHTTTVTDPAGNDTVHTFGAAFGCSVYETQAQYYQGHSNGGTLLKTITTAYSGSSSSFMVGFNGSAAINVVPTQVTTTWPDGHVSKVVSTYDTGVVDSDGTTALIGSLLERDEYDFTNTLVRSTFKHYLWQDNSTYLNSNFVSLQVYSMVKDGSGCEVAKNSHGYDETYNNITQQASGVTMQHAGPPASVRGNRTSTSNWLISSCAEQSSVTSHVIPFDTGETYQSYDPLGNTTTYTYSSGFYGAYPTQTNLPNTGSVHHVISGNYDFNTGLLTSFTDENTQNYSYTYDNMLRLTQANHPDGGITKFTYPDPNTVERQRLISGTTYDFLESKYDGVGRAYQTQLATPDCSSNIQVNTAYDVVGRVATVSNPHCATSDPTYGITTNQYDALGRTTQVTKPDGSTTLATYTGPAVKTQDEGNGTSRTTRVAQNDALGRLVNVCEVTNATQAGSNTPSACNLGIAGTGFLTTYQYDTLNNLRSVQQRAITRSFSYDSLSRLTSAANPESGTTSYSYDNDGNVTTRTRPAPNQGVPSTQITTNYIYDALNRVTQISYSDSVTPTVIRNYDTTSELGVALANTTGRLSAEYTKGAQGNILSGRVFSYDPMGRVKDNSQCTPQNCPNGTAFSVTYSYDVLGDMLTSTDGAGHKFSYTYDSAARLATMTSSLQDSQHPGTMLSGLEYNALGSLTTSSVGGALNESFKWDCRGRILAYASAIAPAIPSQSLANTSGCPNTSASNMLPSMFGLDSAFRLAGLVNPGGSSDSILLSGTAARINDHGVLKVTLAVTNPILRPEEIILAYHEGESALSVAQRLAKEINERRGTRLRASVRPLRSGAILDLTITGDDPWSRSQGSVRVSVSSNRKVPSLRATDLAPPGGTPSLFDGLQTTWTEGQ